jgi:hypothetical protein
MAAVVSSYAMELAGYLRPQTTNDHWLFCYVALVLLAALWALFRGNP